MCRCGSLYCGNGAQDTEGSADEGEQDSQDLEAHVKHQEEAGLRTHKRGHCACAFRGCRNP